MENKNEIYTPMERILVTGALLAEAAETKKKLTDLQALDLMLLEMEAKQDMLDGLKMEAYLL